jgi:hypothetical protein
MKILLRGLPPVFSGHRPKHSSTSQWVAQPHAIDSAGLLDWNT